MSFNQACPLKSWRTIPGTSEFLDWVAILEREQQAKKLTAKELESTHPAKIWGGRASVAGFQGRASEPDGNGFDIIPRS